MHWTDSIWRVILHPTHVWLYVAKCGTSGCLRSTRADGSSCNTPCTGPLLHTTPKHVPIFANYEILMKLSCLHLGVPFTLSLSSSPSSSWQGCVAIVDIIHGLVCLSLPYMLFSTLSWPISPPLFLFQLMLYFLHCNIPNGKGFNIYEEPENFFLELWCVKWEGGDLWEI